MSKQNGENRETVWVGPDLGNGQRPALRFDGSSVQSGTLSPADTDSDHILELKQLKGPFYEVVNEMRATSTGPSQVASKAYRDGWARVFGGKHHVGQA